MYQFLDEMDKWSLVDILYLKGYLDDVGWMHWPYFEWLVYK
jgi:hypothetical protein